MCRVLVFQLLNLQVAGSSDGTVAFDEPKSKTNAFVVQNESPMNKVSMCKLSFLSLDNDSRCDETTITKLDRSFAILAATEAFCLTRAMSNERSSDNTR